MHIPSYVFDNKLTGLYDMETHSVQSVECFAIGNNMPHCTEISTTNPNAFKPEMIRFMPTESLAKH